MNFKNKITKKNGKIYVEISSDNFYSVHKKDRKRIRIEELGMEEMIIAAGHKCGKAIEINIFDNKNTTKTISIFEEVKPPRSQPIIKPSSPIKENKKSYSRKVKKQQKNLDNSQKDVIIEE